jgi:hypothetical protein
MRELCWLGIGISGTGQLSRVRHWIFIGAVADTPILGIFPAASPGFSDSSPCDLWRKCRTSIKQV